MQLHKQKKKGALDSRGMLAVAGLTKLDLRSLERKSVPPPSPPHVPIRKQSMKLQPP